MAVLAFLDSPLGGHTGGTEGCGVNLTCSWREDLLVADALTATATSSAWADSAFLFSSSLGFLEMLRRGTPPVSSLS